MNKSVALKLSLALIANVCLGLMSISSSFAQTIGDGYTCSGKTILNSKGKTVKLSVAKQKVSDKIAALGNNPKNKAKKTTLKQVKTDLSACANGTFSFSSDDIIGTYTGVLNRTSSKGSSSLCDYDQTVTGSFLVEFDGSSVKVNGSINPFHIPVSGKRKAGKFELSGISGAVYRKGLKLTISNVTDTSADFSALREGYAYDPRSRSFVSICQVNYSGTAFARTK